MAHTKGKSSQIPTPTETEDTQKNILKWGDHNEYPYFINYLFDNNAMHSGIIRSKRFFTVSGGLIYDGPDQQAWEEFFKNDKKTQDDRNLDELMWDTSLDFEKSNMFLFKVKLNAIDRKIKRIIEIPFEKFRYQTVRDKDNNTTLTGNVEISNDWLDDTVSVQELEPYKKDDPTQLMFYVIYQEKSGQSLDNPKSRTVNPGHYARPPYGGAITAIDTLIEIDQYNNSEIYNGFSLGTILQFNNGAPSNEEKREELKKKMQKEATGAFNSGGMMMIFNNGKDRAADVLNLNGNNLPDRYKNTKTGAEQSTIHGHSVVSPLLFGVKTEGSLGNSTELQTAYLIMQANYFEARRNALLSVMNWLGKLQGLLGEMSFERPSIQFEPNVAEDGNEVAEALNNMSPIFAAKAMDAMTENEKRALIKLPPLEGGDVLPSGTTSTEEIIFTEAEKDIILGRFSEVGRGKSDMMVLFSQKLTDSSEAFETEFLEQFNKECFQDLSDNQLQVLNLISEDESFDSIRRALDISGTALAGIYKSLSELNMISSTGELLELGATEVAAADISKLEILYEYRLRSNAPALLPGGETRDFCQTLLRLDRLYTRNEISFISGVEGYDVFRFRGGWYHNPNTDTNQPGCRHEWAQVVTFVN